MNSHIHIVRCGGNGRLVMGVVDANAAEGLGVGEEALDQG